VLGWEPAQALPDEAPAVLVERDITVPAEHLGPPQNAAAALPHEVRGHRVVDRAVELRVVGREIDRDRIAEGLEDRKGPPVEVVGAVVEREHDAPRRQVALVQAAHGVVQGQHVATGFPDQLEPPAEHRRRHVELGIPLVLVVERDAVVAQNEQAIAAPSRSQGGFVEPERSERSQERQSRGTQHGGLVRLACQVRAGTPAVAPAAGSPPPVAERRGLQNRRRSWKLRS